MGIRFKFNLHTDNIKLTLKLFACEGVIFLQNMLLVDILPENQMFIVSEFCS